MADVAVRRRPGRRRRRASAVGAGVAVLALGGGAAWALSGSSGPAYRLATVTRGTVDQSVTTTGTVSSVNIATLSFPVSGTVKNVAVSLGDAVTAGQTVATLDTTALQQQLQSMQANAASARQLLARDESGQTGGGAGNGGSGSNLAANAASETPLATAEPSSTPQPSGSSRPSGPSSGTGSVTQLIAAVRRAQQQLLADQHTADLDADVAVSAEALVAANAACAALLADTPTTTDQPTPTGTPTTSGSSSSSTADDLQSCQTAISAVQDAQQKVQTDIDALTGDERALDKAVSALLAALNTSGTGNSPSGSRKASPQSSGKSSSISANSANNSSTVASAAQLAADQQRIDAADAQVTVAQQDLDQATLATPIAGTVGAISISAGSPVSAGSSSATVTIVGAGQEAVQTTVGINDIDLVHKGESVTVTVDGVSTPLTGHVSLVGMLNTSGTSGSSTTYPVTIVLDSTQRLYDGAGATVAIAVGAAQNVLTVPTSALHGTGNATTVDVYRNGKVVLQRVTVGARGVDTVAITSGLAAGDRVVLAEVSAPIPTSTAQNRFGRNGVGGSGGLGNLGGANVRRLGG